jgi:hypothetical protein
MRIPTTLRVVAVSLLLCLGACASPPTISGSAPVRVTDGTYVGALALSPDSRGLAQGPCPPMANIVLEVKNGEARAPYGKGRFDFHGWFEPNGHLLAFAKVWSTRLLKFEMEGDAISNSAVEVAVHAAHCQFLPGVLRLQEVEPAPPR